MVRRQNGCDRNRASRKAFEPNRGVIRHIQEASKVSATREGRSGHPDRQTARDDSSLSCGGACLYFVISLLPVERCLRSCSLCRAFSPKQKRSTAATWQGRSFESLRTGSVRRGWKSIQVHKPQRFLLQSRTLCKHRRKSRKPGLVRRPQHPQRQSRASTRRRLQSGPTAREWLPTHHRDPSRSVPPGGRSRYSAFNLARRGASKPTTSRRQKCLSRSQ